jgi:hypothetical protein
MMVESGSWDKRLVNSPIPELAGGGESGKPDVIQVGEVANFGAESGRHRKITI